MKKIFDKKTIITVMISGIIFTCVGVYASSYLASDISYSPTDSSWEVSNVSEALNDLYTDYNNGYEKGYEEGNNACTSKTITKTFRLQSNGTAVLHDALIFDGNNLLIRTGNTNPGVAGNKTFTVSVTNDTITIY